MNPKPASAAPPVEPSPPAAASAPARAPASPRAPHSSRSRRSRLVGRLLTLAAVLGVLGLMIGVPVYLYRDNIRDAREKLREERETLPVHQPRGGNYRLRVPAEPWQRSLELERDLGVGLALGRANPSSWLALQVTDYKDRMPSEDEMLKVALAKLRGYLQGVQWEAREEERLSGRPARRFVFQGQKGSKEMSGECLMLAAQGLAYWWFSWAPADSDLAAAQDEWTRIRSGFELLRERDGWKGKVPKFGRLEGRKAEYVLSYSEDLWSALEGSGELDQVLVGREPEDPKNVLKGATLSVVVLPKQEKLEEAVKEARGYLERREKETMPEVKIEELADKEPGPLPQGPAQLGTAKAQIVRLRVGAEGSDRFVALAVVPRPEQTLVLVGECIWRVRDAWEPRLATVLESLSFEKN